MQSTDVIYHQLKDIYGTVHTFLKHRNSYELLIAVMLSAQCTDEKVNQVTPYLFQMCPSPEVLANTALYDIEHCIQSINYYRTKAKHIQQTGHQLCTRFENTVPDTLDQLITLPGVGVKTANVVLSQYFKQDCVPVDTHVKRLALRLGISRSAHVAKIEKDLMRTTQKSYWSLLTTLLIIHGRKVCKARRPLCDQCVLYRECSYYKEQ